MPVLGCLCFGEWILLVFLLFLPCFGGSLVLRFEVLLLALIEHVTLKVSTI